MTIRAAISRVIRSRRLAVFTISNGSDLPLTLANVGDNHWPMVQSNSNLDSRFACPLALIIPGCDRRNKPASAGQGSCRIVQLWLRKTEQHHCAVTDIFVDHSTMLVNGAFDQPVQMSHELQRGLAMHRLWLRVNPAMSTNRMEAGCVRSSKRGRSLRASSSAMASGT